MKRHLLSLVCVLSFLVACKSSDSKDDGGGGAANANGGSGDGGDGVGAGAVSGSPSGTAGNETAGAGAASAVGDDSGGAGSGGSAGMDSHGGGGSGSGSGGASTAPACGIPETVVGSCAKKDAMGKIKSCSVYWGSAFTADMLKTACPTEPTLGKNVCPSAGSVGACETSSGPTALANYYYNAADGSPANQAQCNMNTGHLWCTP